ncbi:MAG TPA: MBL fold metallo-hydrolase [Burkholderiaceae bacterium]
MMVIERGWLSANGILFTGMHSTALVDSGYCTHAAQTVELVRGALGTRPLDLLLNTHLHSDHCGGNAALQAAWPGLRTAIAPGQAEQVRQWDAQALGYTPVGQQCPQYGFDPLLEPGTETLLGDRTWQIHAAPGHDPHAVLLFEPASRTLISGDALWENGFGVVFPEIEGVDAFGAVAATLDLIASLNARTVVPGHGPPFGDPAAALVRARQRLEGFVRTPQRHARHAAKVLLKFKLLEWQQVPLADLTQWALETPYLQLLAQRHFAEMEPRTWVASLVDELEHAGALTRASGWVLDR